MSLCSRPRINYRNLEICKMPHVSGCKCGTPRQRDTRDLSVTHIDGSPAFLPCRRQRCSCSRGSAIEIQYTVFQVIFQQMVKRRFKRLSAPTSRQQCQAETRLEQCDTGYPDGFGRLVIQPRYHCSVGYGAHQRAQYISIEDNRAILATQRLDPILQNVPQFVIPA